MQRLKLNQDIKPLSEFRAGVASCSKQIKETKRPLLITQHGKGVGVLLGVDEYQEMQDTIEILQDIKLSMQQINSGLGIDHEEAQAQVLSNLIK